ncbi:hypothetical protein IQ265_17815 [Nodosilinea sp. LEGE 06152]|uniref:hypothetical protein n=1 Tax=Nodosilinea sp. LEGE 06152 TaxID=2777966 RepID=UPI00187E1CDE|nr:hypothetical protein [Nodosilinea sp. LEGE 06152]MBE9158674.1 hypothetical protein [Nodosilinea sp. LEGE 06152]
MDNSSNFIALPPVSPPAANPPEARPPRRPVSFTIGGAESGTSAGNPQPDPSPTDSSPPSGSPAHLAPFPVQAQPSHLPLLPRRKRPTFSRHRHDANPALAVKVLQDIQMAVEAWHQDLKQTVQRIQALYMEGPIVDGWLETVDDQSGTATAIDSALLRHGDPQDLSGYVDRLCQSLESPAPPAAPGHAVGRPGYRLCNLDSDGRVQHFPCPPEQLSTISLAIARHQKLRQLLDHKRFLEAKLKRTVEVMTSSRDALGIAPMCSSEPEVGE